MDVQVGEDDVDEDDHLAQGGGHEGGDEGREEEDDGRGGLGLLACYRHLDMEVQARTMTSW